MIYRSIILKGYTVPNLLMMMKSIDNVEHYLFKGILYCNSLICTSRCETYTLSYLLFTYVYSTTLVELQKSTITKLQIAYHNIFLMFLGMSKYESTSYLYAHFLTFDAANL